MMNNKPAFILTKNFFSSEKISGTNMVDAILSTNEYLKDLPAVFSMDTIPFYTTLNQRNLSGFVGEVFKHSLCAYSERYIPNPHPDGRPDILDLAKPESKQFLDAICFSDNGIPQRQHLAPFRFGGIEVKSTIGNLKGASNFSIGIPRHANITSINYWAHHAHTCELLGLYYDFCTRNYGSPQIKAAFFGSLEASDWNKISLGNPNKKKTSNTSLNAKGVGKIRNSLICHSSEPEYVESLKRIGFY